MNATIKNMILQLSLVLAITATGALLIALGAYMHIHNAEIFNFDGLDGSGYAGLIIVLLLFIPMLLLKFMIFIAIGLGVSFALSGIGILISLKFKRFKQLSGGCIAVTISGIGLFILFGTLSLGFLSYFAQGGAIGFTAIISIILALSSAAVFILSIINEREFRRLARNAQDYNILTGHNP